ncbi:hypothetical protein MMC24_002767 [Lignoscripta atroalba]|nr:hypothetical protein [Lignoscripta atroalba]
MSTPKTSLSSSVPKSRASSPANISDYADLSHPHERDALSEPKQICNVEPLSIKVADGPDGAVAAFLHLPQEYTRGQTEGKTRTAAVLLSGAGGGVVGPSSIYLSMAEKLASLQDGIPVMRLDYRFPARNKYCVADVHSAMKYLEDRYAVARFVLVGWSFGGAPVFTVGGSDKRVVGCATVASQTADTDGIRSLSPTPVLLLHGTGDRTLDPICSRRLYQAYGSMGHRDLQLFDRDDHALTRNAEKAEEMLSRFILKCAGIDIGKKESKFVKETLVGDEERVELMKRGGDLKGEESIE